MTGWIPRFLRRQLADSIPFLHGPTTTNLPIGVQTEEDWTNAIKAMEEGKAISPGSKAKDYFTNDYLDVNLIKAVGEGWPQR